MFIYDSMIQGLELLGQRELQRAERLFLNVINDPYSQSEETKRARIYLNDIRVCQTGNKNLDFDIYKKLVKKVVVSLDYINDLLSEIYFSDASSYEELEQQFSSKIPSVISRLKQIKIFEACEFSEADIQKFLFIDKLNYKTLEEIFEFSQELGLDLKPRDVSIALRGVDKAVANPFNSI